MSKLKNSTREKLIKVSTATVATCLFKKGLRNQWTAMQRIRIQWTALTKRL